MFKRKVYGLIEQNMNNYLIPIVFGLRRIGKTYLLNQIENEYKEARIIIWDDFKYKAMNELDFNNFIISEAKKGGILLFDEVQVIKDWNIIIKNLYDQFVVYKKLKIVVIGSSSMNLTKKDMGLNRVRRIYMDTWDFDEYLNLTKKPRTIDNFETFIGKGFPELMVNPKNNENHIHNPLNSILKSILEEDIPREYNNVNHLHLIKLVVVISKITNGEINETSLSQKTGISIPSIRKYMGILNDSNLLKIVYKINEKGIIPKKKKYKVYLNPHFHIWLLKKPFKDIDSKLKGHIIESYWLNWALSINNFNKEFFYLKDDDTGQEIDFVSLNDDGSFKTLHEFKYKEHINFNDYSLLLKIPSDNKVVWTKHKVELEGVKSISILDLNKK